MKNFAEFMAANREKIYAVAEANTPRNAQGHTVISRSDPWFYEDEWDEEYRKMLDYAFNWLSSSEEEQIMFGQIQLEQFKGLTSMPQKAASAWDGAFSAEMVGAQFKPLLYLGQQVVNGTLHWFIAERTQPYRFEIRNVIKMAILEKDGQYTFDDNTVDKIF